MLRHALTLILMLLGLTTARAQGAFDAHIAVDSPARVHIMIDGTQLTGLAEGLNTFRAHPGTSVLISAAAGCELIEVAVDDPTGYHATLPIEASRSCRFTLYADYAETYTVTSRAIGAGTAPLLPDTYSSIHFVDTRGCTLPSHRYDPARCIYRRTSDPDVWIVLNL